MRWMQPGPREFSNQCLIKRNKKTSTFYLYLALTPCKQIPNDFFSYLAACFETRVGFDSVNLGGGKI